jgi:hypothetical protein
MSYPTIAAALLLSSSCATITPVAEYQHISHATQHFKSNPTNYGYDMIGVGVRWRPTPDVTIQALENYVFQAEALNGIPETFTLRATFEFRNLRK